MKKLVTIEAKRLELFTNLVAAFRLIDYRSNPDKATKTTMLGTVALEAARKYSRQIGDITPEIKLTSEK